MKKHIKELYKLFLLSLIGVCIVLLISGCGNYDHWDTEYSFDRAIVILNDGTKMEIEIQQWRDYEDGEQIQIKGKDGKTYLVSSFNTILIKD